MAEEDLPKMNTHHSTLLLPDARAYLTTQAAHLKTNMPSVVRRISLEWVWLICPM
jgi:hypothetical protein